MEELEAGAGRKEEVESGWILLRALDVLSKSVAHRIRPGYIVREVELTGAVEFEILLKVRMS